MRYSMIANVLAAIVLAAFLLTMMELARAGGYDHVSVLDRVLVADDSEVSGFRDSAVDNMDFSGQLEWSDWGAYLMLRICRTTNTGCVEGQAELLFRESVRKDDLAAWIRAYDISTGQDVEIHIGLWRPEIQQVFARFAGIDSASFVLFFEER